MALTNATVAPRYAKALYEAAEEQGVLPQVASDMDSLAAVLQDNAGLIPALVSPTVPDTGKKAMLKTLKDGASQLTSRLLDLLLSYHRLGALEDIIAAFKTEYATQNGVLEATVTSAVPLTAQQKTTMAQAIASKFNAKSVVVKPVVDPNVLGGVKIFANNRIVDGTLSSRLAKLRAALLTK